MKDSPMTKEQYKNEHGGAPAPSELLVDNEIEETASTWVKMLGNLFNYMPSGLSWNTSIPDDASTAHERRDCSLMDTTPFNDLEQFSTALVALAGDTRIPPWTRETSYTDIPICKQQETWDCGESWSSSRNLTLAETLLSLTPYSCLVHYDRSSLHSNDFSMAKRRR